ncbi:hypothetical protein DL96DRAFT_109414 [Flagelloscypha sp. PMI_526]|nr:hypothetical protein DL96DRAFT_109414 [Flagelloscypha sp. PMI_526]
MNTGKKESWSNFACFLATINAMALVIACPPASSLFSKNLISPEYCSHCVDVDEVNFSQLRLCLPTPNFPNRSAFLPDNLLDNIYTRASENLLCIDSHIEALENLLSDMRLASVKHGQLVHTVETLQRTPVLPTPALPSDILWKIFTAVAKEGDVGCSSLSLVSKEVQRWVDPILFSTMEIDSSQRSVDNLLEAAFTTPRLAQMLAYATSLKCSHTSAEPPAIQKAIRIFPSLENLAICDPSSDPNIVWTPSKFKLPSTVKNIHWQAGGDHNHASYAFPQIFHSITHLSIRFKWLVRSPLERMTFPPLPTLQVLALSESSAFRVEEGQVELVRNTSDTLSSRFPGDSFPSLEVILWRYESWLLEGADLEMGRREATKKVFSFKWAKECADAVSDSRIIVCVPAPYHPPKQSGKKERVWPFVGVECSRRGFWSIRVVEKALELARRRRDSGVKAMGLS